MCLIFFSFLLFKLWKYDNTFIGNLESTEQSYIWFHCILQLFIRFLVGVSISDSHKVIEWIDGRVEGYRRPEKHYEPFQHN